MSNAFGWTVPGYLSFTDWTTTGVNFPDIGVEVYQTGTYFTDQTLLDAVAARDANNVYKFVYTTNPPSTYVPPGPPLIVLPPSGVPGGPLTGAQLDGAIQQILQQPTAQTTQQLAATFVTTAGASSITSGVLSSALGLPAQVYDNFKRSDRNLGFDVGSNGLGYSTFYDANDTELWIIGGLMQRKNTGGSHNGGNGSPILQVPVRSTLQAAGLEYAFGACTTYGPVGAIIGACSLGFGADGVQLAVSPTGWQLFTFVGTSHVVASGTFATQLVTDGVTRYRSLMWYDPASCTLKFSIPTGDGTTNNTLHSVTDATHLTPTTWGGDFLCVQNNNNVNTDPEIYFSQMVGA